MVCMSRILGLASIFLRFFYLLLNIVDMKTILCYDFVFSSLVFHDEMLFKTERGRSEVVRFYFGVSFVAMACISRILGLASIFLRYCYSCAFLKKHFMLRRIIFTLFPMNLMKLVHEMLI